MTEEQPVIPEFTGTLEELKNALRDAYTGNESYMGKQSPKYRYSMTTVLNTIQAKKNAVSKRRAMNKLPRTTRATY